MEMAKSKQRRYIAAGLFLLPILVMIWETRNVGFGWHFWSAFFVLSCVAFIVGQLVENRYVMAAGALINVICELRYLFLAVGKFFYIAGKWTYPFGYKLVLFIYTVHELLILLAFICILFSILAANGLKPVVYKDGAGAINTLREKFPSEKSAFAALILFAAATVLYIFFVIFMGDRIVTVLSELLMYAPIFAAILMLSYNTYASAKSSATIQMPQTSDKIYRLLNIKELLDSGIISQEEFDEKKKQILGP